MQQINQGNPVSLNMVNEYTRLYTKDQLQLVPQERVWGLTEQAEIINGRTAMFFLVVGLLTEYWTGQSIPDQVFTMLRVGSFIGPDGF